MRMITPPLARAACTDSASFSNAVFEPGVDLHAVDNFLSKAVKPEIKYHLMRRLDQMVKYEQMAAQVGRMKSVDLAAARRQLIAAGVDETTAKAMVDKFGNRSGVLERVLAAPDMFGGEFWMELAFMFGLIRIRFAGGGPTPANDNMRPTAKEAA